MIAALSIASLEIERDDPTSDEEVFTAVVELPSGQALHLYEADRLHVHWVRPNVEEVCVLAHPAAGAKRLETVTPRIEPPDRPVSKWSYDLYGTVAKVGASLCGDRDLYLLDVGHGTILVAGSLGQHLSHSDTPLSVGDALFVPTVRVDLYEDQALRC